MICRGLLALMPLMGLQSAQAAGERGPLTRPATVPAEAPSIDRFRLQNGLSVSIIHVHNDRLFTIHTHMPNGYAFDEPDHIMWARLMERLSSQTAAENDGTTLVDRIRVTSWSRPTDWERTLESHAQMLSGKPCSREGLQVFQEDTLAIGHWGGPNAYGAGAAAFAQAFFHAASHIDVSRQINSASVSEMEVYRDAHWRCLGEANTCVVTGLDPAMIRAAIEIRFGRLPTVPLSTLSTPITPQLRLSWDQKHAAVIVAWKVPDRSPPTIAALSVLESILNQNLGDPLETRVLTAVNCPRFPGGPMFLRVFDLDVGGRYADDVAEEGRNGLEKLLSTSGLLRSFEKTRDRLARLYLLSAVPRLKHSELRDEYGSLFRLHEYWRRAWANIEYGYGSDRQAIGEAIQSMSAEQFTEAASQILRNENCVTCIISPRPATGLAGQGGNIASAAAP